jgi:transposase-like protein
MTTTSTNKKGYRIAKEVKEQILKRIKEEGVAVQQAAQDHGVSEKTIYHWLAKGVSGNPSWTEFAKLKKENKGLLELVGSLTMKLSTAQKND